MAAPRQADAPNRPKDPKAASGRRVGICTTTYGGAALRLLDNGYEPLPIVPRAKRPAVDTWTTVPIDVPAVERWVRQFGGHGVGLRTGLLVGIDIDILDPELAHQIEQLVRSRLGDTLVRAGRWPKRLLAYRSDAPFPKIVCGDPSGAKVEVLGRGQQFVAFGVHPDTGRPYHWADGDSPLDVAIEDLPRVGEQVCQDVLAEIEPLLPLQRGHAGRASSRRRPAATGPSPGPAGPVHDERGIVIDGRDGWLSTIAYHAVQDALDASRPIDRRNLAQLAWGRFETTTDLGRPKACGDRYGPQDAARKVEDKLRLLGQGRLPPRTAAGVDAAYVAPTLTAEDARRELDTVLQEACDRVAAWHADPSGPRPQIGIRGTVGLGKSARSRRALLVLRDRLSAAGAPSRILVFVPTHQLAEEAARLWRQDGVTVAVLRGYEARHPALRLPMCRDLPAVSAAFTSGLPVHETACAKADRRCAHFDGCLKQQNRAEIAAADVVIAAHDALFSGFAVDASSIGVIVVDESCWQRATRTSNDIHVENFVLGLIGHSLRGPNSDDEVANLQELRRQAAAAMATPGPVARSRLVQAGLDAETCGCAIQLEARRLRDPGLLPGMPAGERKQAMRQVKVNELTYRYIEVWQAMIDLIAGELEYDGRLHVRAAPDGQHEIVVTGLKPIHPTLRDKPVLHLDATLRPDLARGVLGDLEVQEIDAAAPHMSVRLVTSSFGKGQLCPAAHLQPDEAQRRRNRLAEVVTYVRWQAVRVAPGRTLVVTYKDIEGAFQSITGVEVAHFNAIAGLDVYRDVRLLMVVGRPLPRDTDLDPLVGAFFRRLPTGGYEQALRGVRMRDGGSRAVQARVHADARAEVLRAAICDDELIQAIGRGRGINRTEVDPLEVHVLADAALPLVHDQVVPWDLVAPDIVQHMLLAGVAVDSPGDASRLHPALFTGRAQAEKVFQRGRFGGQNPIRDLYREMSVKSAAYRRPGRGCSWQRVYWICGDNEYARNALEAAVGPLAEWRPCQP